MRMITGTSNSISKEKAWKIINRNDFLNRTAFHKLEKEFSSKIFIPLKLKYIRTTYFYFIGGTNETQRKEKLASIPFQQYG